MAKKEFDREMREIERRKPLYEARLKLAMTPRPRYGIRPAVIPDGTSLNMNSIGFL